jgi:hypothetical protein
MAGFTFGWTCADLEAVVTRHSGDPLGLRAWANRVARDLTPGVTDVMNRVQGYAVFCAGLLIADDAASDKLISANEAFLRFEALWVHAQTRHRSRWGLVSVWERGLAPASLSARGWSEPGPLCALSRSGRVDAAPSTTAARPCRTPASMR